MQIFLSKFRFFLFVVGIVILIGCGAGEDTEDIDPSQPIIPNSDQSGTVSGTLTNSITNNPISGVVVTLLDRETTTGADGTFTFHDIPYAESLQITVEDHRYKKNTHTFTLNEAKTIVNVSLTPLAGTVSGTVTDANTNNPIPGAVVSLLGIEVNAEVDGIFTFMDIPYVEEHEITVEDPLYQTYTHSFMLDKERLVLKIELVPINDSEEELNTLLENFSDLIESLDDKNLPAIQELFSETYVASNDPVTLLGVLSGDIPANYDALLPTFTNIFETYSWLQFAFKDRNWDITHARKASIELLLDVDSERAEDETLRQIEAKCVFEFRREETEWKIVFWQLLNLDIRL
ncbi:MAG: carboxypeptidase-like regulatory domain-containing protein [Candidatus Poribacteria bacterium]|nr:carboxypeptidase-like regulatory domain-containing protein [Candidatus Poribacteria bacterium]